MFEFLSFVQSLVLVLVFCSVCMNSSSLKLKEGGGS